MNRKTFLIVIITIFITILVLVIGGYFYLTNTKTNEDSTKNEVTGSLVENNIIDTTPVSENNSTSTTSSNGEIIPRVRQLTTTPVAGYDFVDTASGYSIWYIERANGNVHKTSTSSLATVRITNTTIPKVYEAYIGKGGSNIILRTLNDSGEKVQTFIGTPKASSTLSGFFTSDSISLLSMAPTKDRFFGMTGSTAGIGNIYSSAGKATNIFTHSLKKWVPQWVSTNTVVMTSAPSAKTQNVTYFLNPTTKAFTKVLGPKNGLVVSSSPIATKLLFSENKGNALAFGVYDVKTSTETPVSSGTIPDKCVWSKKDPSVAYCGFPKTVPAGAYPDDWYQGKTSFADTIRTLDTDTYNFNTVVDISNEAGTAVDTTNLMLSSDEKYLLFTNKADLTLWMVQI
jgi:hypothetical protein